MGGYEKKEMRGDGWKKWEMRKEVRSNGNRKARRKVHCD